MVSTLRKLGVTTALAGSALLALAPQLSADVNSFTFMLNGSQVTIARAGPTCPGSCIQPMQIAAGVETYGELEVIDFLQTAVGEGRGLVIDVRMPSAFSIGSVPGAINVPVATFRPDNPYRNDLLSALGVMGVDTAAPEFANAYGLLIYSSGPDDAQAANAIKDLLASGYPADRIKFYRGGAAGWSTLGLSLAVGQ